MSKGLRAFLSFYLLSFCLPWLRVYTFLTWGGPFEESDAGRTFYGWELVLRYWPFFLALLLLFLLTWKLRSRPLLLALALVGFLTSLWLVTFGDFFQVTPRDYILLFRHYSFRDILPAYFLQFLLGGIVLYQMGNHVKKV